jgi:hypothetical protein
MRITQTSNGIFIDQSHHIELLLKNSMWCLFYLVYIVWCVWNVHNNLIFNENEINWDDVYFSLFHHIVI